MNLFKPKTNNPPSPQLLERVATKYNDIMAIQNGRFREIWFVRGKDFFLQSRIDAEDPASLVLVYSRMMMAGLFFQPAPRRILMVGLGGSAVSNCFQKWCPDTVLDVVEIDREIIEIARKYFFLRESERCRVHEEDGRIFVKNMQGKAEYDLVFLDAFKSGSIPYHLKTSEFYREISSLLAPGGVVSSNLYGKSNVLKPNDLKTFSAVFKQIYVFEDPEEIATVLHATHQDRRSSPEEMQRAADELVKAGRVPPHMRDVPAMQCPGKFDRKDATAFCDDFPKDKFFQAVDKNNVNLTLSRPYPIKSSG
ncbi:MAG: fused MFS/spermidine synthase [Nitrospinae bacterium]|nr:fused MFS/spermidine synthase [Nitrospinota bacterium]